MTSFSSTANSNIRRKGKKYLIKDLNTDLKTGVKLCALLETLTGEKIKVGKKNPKMEVHCLENLGIAVGYIKKYLADKKAKPLVNVGGRDVYNGNERIILGLMWKLILEFQVADIEIDGISGA